MNYYLRLNDDRDWTYPITGFWVQSGSHTPIPNKTYVTVQFSITQFSYENFNYFKNMMKNRFYKVEILGILTDNDNVDISKIMPHFEDDDLGTCFILFNNDNSEMLNIQLTNHPATSELRYELEFITD